jgi:hypothetical protein
MCHTPKGVAQKTMASAVLKAVRHATRERSFQGRMS